MRIDIKNSHRDKHRVICTDFGATLDLGSVVRRHFSMDNHAVMCIFEASNWQEVEFSNIQGEQDSTLINDCDKWVFFGQKISKGIKRSSIS